MNGDSNRYDLGFGRRFTDHMILAGYDASRGWSDIEVVGFRTLALSPAAMVFHYGQAVFEGLKAFRQPDGGVALFRPYDHAVRFDRSARRLAMPTLGDGVLTAACSQLVCTDHRAVPSEPGQSLYLRPMLIATEAALGVRAASEYRFVVIASPVGSYFASGLMCLRVWATGDYVRAVPGGTGSAKCAGNYAAGLAAREQSAGQGCDETLWLDAVGHQWVEELSGMNIVFVANGPTGSDLVTPPVTGTILDGVTRRSLLQLARSLGYGVVERPVSIEEVHSPGSFVEAFACGTAAVVAPIGMFRSSRGELVMGDGGPGPVTVRLRDALVALQEGASTDPFGWRVAVPVPTTMTPTALR